MSAQNWKPGDVAIKARYSLPSVVVSGCNHNHAEGPHWHHGSGGWDHLRTIGRMRRLVVIDPEDREKVERLAQAYRDDFWGTEAERVNFDHVDSLQAALREFANPTPPKPDEPIGHLAVVIDTDGNRWINWRDLRDDMDHERPWVLASDGFTYRDYADIDVAEIKWEGIQ